MSVLSLSRPASRSTASLRAVFAAWIMRRRSRAALARLDDHLLADIGLTRADAIREKSRPFWNE
ncbi:DUF1127 domain-containing protein [Phaeovulum sp.]|uniref:DUF1127 domain-containing protein n=1 Tax=Phaeovulum sp. TaxID=2934796 RepID=UPI0035635811